MTIEELLSESVEEARRREKNAFDEDAGVARDRIVLFGAGKLGRKTAVALRREGIVPLAFLDNNQALQGACVDNIPVFSPVDGAARWGDSAVFVVTVFHPSVDEGMAWRLQFLKNLGCKRVTTFLTLGWRIDGVLPHFAAALPSVLLGHAKELSRVSRLFRDQVSTELFAQQLSWRLRGDFFKTGDPAPDQYFPKDLVRPNSREEFVDGGAFDGDTLRALPWGYRRAWAVEPDPINRAKLEMMKDHRIVVLNTALGDESGWIRFNADGTMGSARAEQGRQEVRVSRLDDLLVDESPTYVKLDVEGDELPALRGGCNLLRRAHPVVSVCVYHRPEDIWTIPLYLYELNPDQNFALRAHARDGFELVAYAIPPPRALG